MYKAIIIYTILLIGLIQTNVIMNGSLQTITNNNQHQKKILDTATFGAGCFWCVETIFQQLNGVGKVVSGYSGGTLTNPTYNEICSGETGHAEVCQIQFDPSVISYSDLLEVFWQVHDPTTLNRQGADIGTQYRSVIFYHNEDQRSEAEEYKRKLNKSGIFKNPVITEISLHTKFYPAEDNHQDYYQNNPSNAYCQKVITPKIEKFKKVFADKLKE